MGGKKSRNGGRGGTKVFSIVTAFAKVRMQGYTV